MVTRIVPARLGHALAVAKRIGGERDLRPLLRQRFIESSEAWVLLVDGKAEAVGGWKGALLSGEAEAWLAATEAAKRQRFTLVRAVIAQARRLAAMGIRITAWVAEDDGKACAFARFCGLDPTAAVTHSPAVLRRWEFG